MACTLLLAAFSGQLREFVLKPKPIYWIDSWEDLHDWKHLVIQTNNRSEIVKFTETHPNEKMAKDFEKRFEMTRGDIDDIMSWQFDEQEVKDGKIAVAFPYFVLQILKRSLISDDLSEDIDFHISGGDESQPFYSITSRLGFDDESAAKFDLV